MSYAASDKDLDALVAERLKRFKGPFDTIGKVTGFVGTIIRARVPDVRLGDRCVIERPGGAALMAEVVGFEEDKGVTLMPLGHTDGISLDNRVHPSPESAAVPIGNGLRGRVLNALGEPIDGKGPLSDCKSGALIRPPPNPLTRRRVDQPLATGVRCIDTLLTTGVGQRVGIFAPAGGGKSTLLASISRHVEADAVVLALIGERGREVEPFIRDHLGPEGLAKATVVVSTSDEPALLRLKAGHTATAIAEAQREQGLRVVLLMDSVTRFARALREVGLAAGELPARRGFPPSVFAELPRLFERTGNDSEGSITAFYTVLVEGDIQDDPIAEETKSLLDGHIILSETLSRRQHYPAIDVLASKSRLMNEIVSPEHEAASKRVKAVVETFESNRVKISLGLYSVGSDPVIDHAIRHFPSVEAFLRQSWRDSDPFDNGVEKLKTLAVGA